MKDAHQFTRRNLPHIKNAGSTYFVTSSLFGALPKKILTKLKEEHQQQLDLIQVTESKNVKRRIALLSRQYFKKFDTYLDKALSGPTYFNQPDIAALLKEQFHRFDGAFYDLLAYTIMPNHFHLLIDTSIQLPSNELHITQVEEEYADLSKIMFRIKGASARYCNLALNRKGQFWMEESFDRFMRNENEQRHYLNYILQNPVKAGIVEDWMDFPFSFCKEKNMPT